MKKSKKSGSKTKPILFVPLTKVDEEKRLVYGTMVQGDIVDHSNEVFDYDSSKPNFEKWSRDVEKASGGKSLGNVRSMHGNVAAGKLTDIDFNDDAKIISCCAKIVDDAEWNKVLEGVYTGFSIGGSYTKKWKDGDATRYTADPVEVSIVDVPCIPTATFDLQRADGVIVKTVFKAAKEYVPSNEEIARKATELATAIAASESWVNHIEEARAALIQEDADKKAARQQKKEAKETEAGAGNEEEDEANEESSDEGGNGDSEEDAGEDDSKADDEDEGDEEADDEDKKKKKEDAEKAARNQLSQVWKATDGRTFGKKSEAITHQATINARASASPLQKALDEAAAALGGEDGDVPACFKDLATAAKVVAFLQKKVEGSPMNVLQKGLYDVGWFARVIEDIACIQSCAASEADWEADDSQVPKHLKENIQQLILTFIEMAMEESAELIARLKPEEVEEVVAGATVTEGVGGSQEDDTADPEVAQHAAEAVKFLVGEKTRLEKIGARNSKSDAEKLQKAHDALVDLGVACKAVSADDNAEEEGEAQKLAKMVETERDTLREEVVELRKQIADSVPAIKKLTDEIKVLKAKPGPSAPRTSVVEKTADRNGANAGSIGGGTAVNTATVEEQLAKMTPDQRVDLMIRLGQQQPQALLERK